MDFNDSTVKITENELYKSLDRNRQEQIRALVSSYDRKYKDFYQKNQIKMQNILDNIDKQKKKDEMWGTVLTFTTLGAYDLVNNLFGVFGELWTGATTMLSQLTNDITRTLEVAKDGISGKYRNNFNDFVKDLAGQAFYTIANPATSMVEGLALGSASAVNAIFTMPASFLNHIGVIDDKQLKSYSKEADRIFNLATNVISDTSLSFKANLLREPLDSNYVKDPFGMSFMSKEHGLVRPSGEKEREIEKIENQNYALTQDAIKTLSGQGIYWQDKIAPSIANVLTLGIGSHIDRLGRNELAERFGGIMGSVGRMIPAIAMSYAFGSNESLAKALTTSYFFTSTYGGSFNEAIRKNASIQEASRYAYSHAIIETLTEEMGGIKLGEKVAGSIFKNMIDEAFEEVVAELADSGVSSIIASEDVSNHDIFERSLWSAIGGAISGGILTGATSLINKQTTVGKTQALNNLLVELYADSNFNYEGTQNKFNNELKYILDVFNSDNKFDNILMKFGEQNAEGRFQGRLNLLDNSMLSLLIEYDTKNNTFILTEQGVNMMQDLKGFMVGKQDGVAINKEDLLISSKTDGGLIYDSTIMGEKLVITPRSELANMDAQKRNFLVNFLGNTRNVVGFKGGEGRVEGFFRGKNGVLYINTDLPYNKLLKGLAHELSHKAELTNKDKFDTLADKIMDSKMTEALRKKGIEIMPKNVIDAYMKIFEAQGLTKAEIQQRLRSEYVATFIEMVLNNNKVLIEAFGLNPSLMDGFEKVFNDSDLKKVDKKVGKLEKLTSKLYKESNKFKMGSLRDAVMRNMQKTSYIRVNNKVFRINEKITGFVNNNGALAMEANINETHFTKDGSIERQYSDFSKNELLNFYEMFDAYNFAETDMNDVINNIIKEYDNIIEYKEIVGTKYSFLWSMFFQNPNIRNEFMPFVNERISDLYNKGVENGSITKVEGQDGLYQVKDAKLFRDIFALNYIILKPEHASSVTLLPTDAYMNEAQTMYLFEDGKGGWVIANDTEKLPESYKDKNRQFHFATYLESFELASVFSNGEKGSFSRYRNFIEQMDGIQLVTTNTRQLQFYADMGFKDLIFGVEYSNKAMSEWSNSYNNWFLYSAELNKVTPLYAVLGKPIIVESSIGTDTQYKINFGDGDTLIDARKEKNLVALHNLEGKHLLEVLKMQGIPMPSVAIFNVPKKYQLYGDYTIVLGKDSIDPKVDSRNKIYAGDKFTSVFPRTTMLFNEDKMKRLQEASNNSNAFEYENFDNYINSLGMTIDKFINYYLSFDTKYAIGQYIHENKINMSTNEFIKTELEGAYEGLKVIRNDDTLIDFSAENIVEVMKEKNDNPIEQFGLTIHTLKANMLTPLTSIEEIHKIKEKIISDISNDKEMAELLKIENISIDRYERLFDRIARDNKIDIYPAEIKRSLKEDFLENVFALLSSKYIDGKIQHSGYEDSYFLETYKRRIENMFKEIYNLPILYSEAKPERVVRLNEIKKVYYNRDKISNPTLHKQILKSLQENGIPFDHVSDKGLDHDIREMADLDDDIMFKVNIDNEEKSAEFSKDKNLVAFHNLSVDKLMKVLQLGGFPMPSIAIKPYNFGHEDYGNISIIFGKSTIDPMLDKRNKVWSGDKWTATVPQIQYDFNESVLREVAKEFDKNPYTIKTDIGYLGIEGASEALLQDITLRKNDLYKKLFEVDKVQKDLEIEQYVLNKIASTINDTGIYNGQERFTPSGNRRSFKALHYEVSLENIVKVMKQNNDNSTFGNTFGQVVAETVKDFKSIEEMKKNINKIANDEIIDINNTILKEKMVNLIYSINELKRYKDSNQFIDFDNSVGFLRELAKRTINKENIEKWYNEFHINGNEQLTRNIMTFFEDVESLKMMRYFESKPERVVRLNEIKKVIFRDTKSLKNQEYVELIKMLDNLNIPYENVDIKGVNVNIERLANIDDDIMFKVSENKRTYLDKKKEVKTEIEIKHVNQLLKNSYSDFDRLNYEITLRKRLNSINDIDYDQIKTKVNGAKIQALIKDLLTTYERVIKYNVNRSEIFNHLFNNVLQEVVLQLANNYEGNSFKDLDLLLDGVQGALSESMAYVDKTFNKNELNMLRKDNPEGYQYTKLIHWGFRDILETTTNSELMKVLSSGKVNPFWNLLHGLVELDIDNKQKVSEFYGGLTNFRDATYVAQRNSISLNDSGEVNTIPNVLRQNKDHISNLITLAGEYTLVKKDGKKSKYERTNGLLGKYNMFDRLSGTRLDMYAFSNIFGMFMEKSTGNVMAKNIHEAQIKQLQVTNAFNDYFEKDGWLKNNSKSINELESTSTPIKNLVDSNGNIMLIPNSQIITLRDLMLREIIRDRMIDYGFRGGEKSNRFADGNYVYLSGNEGDRLKNKGLKREGTIINTLELFHELNNVVENNKFMRNYNKKILEFFDILYDFENIRFKDIRGLELTSDSKTIKNLTQEQITLLKEGLGDVDITNIYIPMRVESLNKGDKSGAFNINSVIDLGIDDGMVMGITETNKPALIDSINTLVPSYVRSVANFYGLYRVVSDLNILFNKDITLPNGQEVTLTTQTNKLSPYIIPYYEKLLRDISGYNTKGDVTGILGNRAIGTIRRNFFKASLGLNIKVITTQFASAFTVATIYGDYKGSKMAFTAKMFANMFGKGSKTKANYLIENSEIYKDRARNATYEMSEAKAESYIKNKFDEITEFSMMGINLTDSMINRALFITLVDEGMSEYQAMKIVEEGITRYQSTGLAIGKNELLRTQNEWIKFFTLFMSEPLKITSNMEESIRHLNLINKLEANQQAIKEHFKKVVLNEKAKLEHLQKEYDEHLEKLEKEKDAKKKKKLEEEARKQAKIIDEQAKQTENTERNARDFEEEIEKTINNKQKTKDLFAKRFSAMMASVGYQALLAVTFGLLRGNLDEKDEEEAMWKYLSKQYGWAFAGEMVDLIPFARDVYSLVVNKFDANRISELQAVQLLITSVTNLTLDLANGKDFNYLKHLRTISLYSGQVLGVPTRQIERLFTTPANLFAKDINYVYRDITGQKTTNKELEDAIKKGDTRLIEAIVKRKLQKRNISLTFTTSKEINRLARNHVIVSPNGVPDTFSIEGIIYENDKKKFSETYNNATFVIEKLIQSPKYTRLDDEHKGMLIKAVFNYYYNLSKQEVSGVAIYAKNRTYNLNQAYGYFYNQINYYMNMQNKKKRAK